MEGRLGGLPRAVRKSPTPNNSPCPGISLFPVRDLQHLKQDGLTVYKCVKFLFNALHTKNRYPCPSPIKQEPFTFNAPIHIPYNSDLPLRHVQFDPYLTLSHLFHTCNTPQIPVEPRHLRGRTSHLSGSTPSCSSIQPHSASFPHRAPFASSPISHRQPITGHSPCSSIQPHSASFPHRAPFASSPISHRQPITGHSPSIQLGITWALPADHLGNSHTGSPIDSRLNRAACVLRKKQATLGRADQQGPNSMTRFQSAASYRAARAVTKP